MEPSRLRGAPEVPEPLTIGAQYLTRYHNWKILFCTTRPALQCAGPRTNTRVKFSSSLRVPYLENSIAQKPLARKVESLPRGDSMVPGDSSPLGVD